MENSLTEDISLIKLLSNYSKGIFGDLTSCVGFASG